MKKSVETLKVNMQVRLFKMIDLKHNR